MLMRWFAACIRTIAISLLGCSASTEMPAQADRGQGGSGAVGSGTGGSGGLDLGDGGSGAGVSDEGCLVYLIGQDTGLYTFNPPTLEVEQVGFLDCPPLAFPGGRQPSPFSMAVSRKGVAWVLYNSGHLYNVDIETLACSATAYQTNQQGFLQFGMAFVSDTPGGDAETLYVSDFEGKGLATIDTETLHLDLIGPYLEFEGSPAELTGTGSGRLFGLFHDIPELNRVPVPETVAEIDKASADMLASFPQPDYKIIGGWAFAFWGGDFYMLTAPNGGSSEIHEFSPETGITKVVVPDVGSLIVGAGVSTCAPIEPPG